jgi:lipopolysaccharide/colanic/teichoic acid biosynthesis glycosyltransferase
MNVKRLFDVVVVAVGAFVALPVIVVIAGLVRIFMGSPVLFRQVRPGRGGVAFELVKFRTMAEAIGKDGHPLPDAERLSRVGSWLRRTSLDELPELWNVLRGDMSLVGPRPLLMEYLPLYSPRQARRHEVRPGLTGWAQVNGRNALSWEEKFELDVWYVENQTFWLDLRILLKTIGAVLGSHGISAVGEATVQRFTGSVTRE